MAWEIGEPGTVRTQNTKGPSEALRANAKVFLEKLDVRISSIKIPTFQILANIQDLELPKRGQQLRIRTQQQINLISMVLKIAEAHDQIDELAIATYTLNKESLSVLLDLLRAGRIKKLSLFLASAYSFRDKDYFEHLKRVGQTVSKEYDFHLIFAWLHFKITLVRCGEDYYQMEGSMNYSMNNMAEQILFENSKDSYDYDHTFLMSILTKTGNKALEIIC